MKKDRSEFLAGDKSLPAVLEKNKLAFVSNSGLLSVSPKFFTSLYFVIPTDSSCNSLGLFSVNHEFSCFFRDLEGLLRGSRRKPICFLQQMEL